MTFIFSTVSIVNLDISVLLTIRRNKVRVSKAVDLYKIVFQLECAVVDDTLLRAIRSKLDMRSWTQPESR